MLECLAETWKLHFSIGCATFNKLIGRQRYHYLIGYFKVDCVLAKLGMMSDEQFKIVIDKLVASHENEIKGRRDFHSLFYKQNSNWN